MSAPGFSKDWKLALTHLRSDERTALGLDCVIQHNPPAGKAQQSQHV